MNSVAERFGCTYRQQFMVQYFALYTLHCSEALTLPIHDNAERNLCNMIKFIQLSDDYFTLVPACALLVTSIETSP